MLSEALTIKGLRGELLQNQPLSHYTSWRTGGPADYVYLPADLDDLSFFLQNIPNDIPLTWLGLGSNTLVRDGGIEGIVVITQGGLKKISQIESYLIRAEAGIACAQLARYSARLSAKGLEFMAGIPGTVGGALAMNAGCFGGETWQFVNCVEVVDRSGRVKKRPVSDYKINYRHVEKSKGEWFVAGYFNLQPGDKETSLQEIRELIDKRNASQPTGTANCGSVFRNPEGNYAGKLIESCGLKGMTIGGASVSSKHANFILNENHASSTDIERLISEIQTTVASQTGVLLVPEVHIIGRK